MKKNNKGEDINALCSVFPSITSFAEYLGSHNFTPRYAVKKSSITGTKDFCKTSSYEEAHDKLMYGDADLQKKIEKAGLYQTRQKLRRMQNRRVVYPSVVGFAPHVPNYIAGVPTSMINARTKKIKQKIVTIAYDIQAGCDEKASDMIKAAAEFVSACMMIEAQGIRLNIYAVRVCESTESDKMSYNLTAIKIKESGQQFDTLKMVYPLIHPSMLRRHIFRYMEVTEGLDDFCFGYGACVGRRSEANKVIEKATKADVIVSYSQCKYMTADDIMKLVEKQ